MKSILVALLIASLASAAIAAEAPSRPNILYIMADDHAAHAISAYSGRINKTPNLDRLAQEGMRLDACFCVNSICTPSRACILTGKYSHKNGVPVFNRFDGSQPTLAKYLQAAGYHTGMIGKWHLGSDPTGFDRWTILPGQGVYHNPDFLEAAGRRQIQGYVTDIITDLAIDFLKERPKDKPFFLMCHHKAPHRPWDPDDKHFTLYDDGDIPEPATLRDDYATRTDAAREATMRVGRDLNRRDVKADPPPGLSGDDLLKWKYQRFIKDYLRCVASIDDNVGRLLDFLDKEGLSKNTVVIYTSDQGFFLGDHGWFDKRFMYEQSIRMPFLVRWPGVVKSASTQAAMALNIDFAPTMMEIAGLQVPADMQGRSLLPLLKGQRPADWRTSWYYRYYHDPGDHNTRAHYGVRTETQKLIYFWKKDQWECYDLVHDPDELHNLAGDPAHADLVAKLKAEMYRLKKEVQDNDEFAEHQPTTSSDGPRPKPAKAKRPKANFVVVLIDDLGYGDIGPFGSTLNRTPRLDRMAREGMKLTSFYGAPVCTPSRAQMMTGCYAKRVSLPNVIGPVCPIGISAKERTIAELLKQQGYATMAVGKWHLGDQPAFLPTRHGFDHYLGLPYSNDMGGRPPLPLLRDGAVIEAPADQDTLTARYTREAVKFIHANKDRPFFLYLPHTAVHVPLHPGAAFKGKSANGTYGDWVEEVDWSVGRVLDTLRELKLAERTFVLFTSDNGPWLMQGKNGGIAGPLHGGKATTWEGGMREPSIAWWPGRIAAGTVCDATMSEMDVLPTLVKLAGGEVPADRKIDGKDIWPLLAGQSKESPHEALFYFLGNQLQAVRSGPWKLAIKPQGTGLPQGAAQPVRHTGPRLYNLDSDIGELRDVAAQHADVVSQLQKFVEQMDSDLGVVGTGPGVRAPDRVERPQPLLKRVDTEYD